MFEFYLLMGAIFLAVVTLVVILVVVNKRQIQSDDAHDASAFEIKDDMVDTGNDTSDAGDKSVAKTDEADDDEFEDERLMNRLNNVVERRTRDE